MWNYKPNSDPITTQNTSKLCFSPASFFFLVCRRPYAPTSLCAPLVRPLRRPPVSCGPATTLAKPTACSPVPASLPDGAESPLCGGPHCRCFTRLDGRRTRSCARAPHAPPLLYVARCASRSGQLPRHCNPLQGSPVVCHAAASARRTRRPLRCRRQSVTGLADPEAKKMLICCS
jgi:hypothetical protein